MVSDSRKDMINKDEADLIHACNQGDARAQRKLYDKYAKTMYGVCLRYSYTKDDARDMLQEGFVRVFTKLGQFAFNGSFEGWMKRIFVNTALLHYRDNKKHMYHNDAEAASDFPAQQNILEKITVKEILKAMNGMAPGYRNILNLYIIEGYSHAEIAEMLQISEGTSKSQLSRARALLQNLLKKDEPNESR